MRVVRSLLYLLGNTAWSTESDFAQLRKLHARADLWSAFRDGPIIVESLSVDGLALNLEQRWCRG